MRSYSFTRVLQWLSDYNGIAGVVTETLRPAKPKIFIIWPITGNLSTSILKHKPNHISLLLKITSDFLFNLNGVPGPERPAPD